MNTPETTPFPSTCPATAVGDGVASIRYMLAQGRVKTTYHGANHIVAGALTHFSLRVEADFTLPAGTSVALARRWPSDWGAPQWTCAQANDFVRVITSGAASLRWWHERRHTWHPFDHALVVELQEELKASEFLAIEFGGKEGESPGFSAQTFSEEASPLSVRIMLPPSREWVEIAKPTIRIGGGEASRLVVTVPACAQAGSPVEIHVRAEDAWGNPAGLRKPLPLLLSTGDGQAIPLVLPIEAWARAKVTLTQPGLVMLQARAPGSEQLAIGSAHVDVTVRAPASRLAWGDLHAQSAIGCGVRSIEDYYGHARDFAATDFGSHQANCFLVSAEEWKATQDRTREANEAGRFVTLLGVEWSGASRLGGDHNVYFPGDEAELRRCSHQFVRDKSDSDTDLPHVTDLYAHYRDTDTLMAVHVGGRTADLQFHEPGLERLLEVHSTHATSEWFLFDALRRGYRFGVVAGSDSVDGRPGASHPGRMAVRNVRGGLTAVEVPELTRAALWSSLKARRCYATTGERIHLSLRAGQLRMGDEAALHLGATEPMPGFEVKVTGTAPIETVEFFRDDHLLLQLDPAQGNTSLSDRVRIGWRGAAGQGNWERARMIWDGELRIEGARILSASPWAMDTPDEGIIEWHGDRVTWRSVTAGDWDGVVLQLDRPEDAVLTFATEQMTLQRKLRTLGVAGWMHELQSPWRALELKRLPAVDAPIQVSHEFTDAKPLPGRHAYWVRVRQADGAYAWSTPIFLDITVSESR